MDSYIISCNPINNGNFVHKCIKTAAVLMMFTPRSQIYLMIRVSKEPVTQSHNHKIIIFDTMSLTSFTLKSQNINKSKIWTKLCFADPTRFKHQILKLKKS